MIPERIAKYLQRHLVPFDRWPHRRAITAQELAATIHAPGRRVAKSVMVEAGGKVWIALLPATKILDLDRLASLLGVPGARLLSEPEFKGLFPDCEPGAEPPFGTLYGLPVVVDSALTGAHRVLFRAGSHEEAIEMSWEDFYRLEGEPFVGDIGRPQPVSTPWDDWPESASP